MEKGQEMVEKVLIANRGEIACRIMRSCTGLGLKTVAVYSEADSEAMHVALADEAVPVGPAAARDSYLRAEAILDAARHTGARAVHPGYGFLSENAAFARAVQDAGLVWVGPSPESIANMGDKERAREIAKAAGVPVLPGSPRFRRGSDDGLLPAAQAVGFPLLVKAAAGGGGIGMRRVDCADSLLQIAQATQSMAEKAFGDSSIYLEHYVEKARHVEVQVFGYGDGSGVHLYDRDCSIQRRFQKIIEEAPAPGLPESVRSTLHESALALLACQKYSGAGTVEFVYDCEHQRAWFLEMNTRIQVEHPVTEMVTGIDLVSWQILQAFNRLAPVRQGDVGVQGHAVECRLYAERPEKNFLPSPGRVDAVDWPPTDASFRIDTGVRAGDRVTPYYDPMIAKFAAHGSNRDEAARRLVTGLDALHLQGLHTNAAFLHRLLTDECFLSGQVDTGLAMRVLAQGEAKVELAS